MCLLDTVGVSETRKTDLGRADPNLAAWMARLHRDMAYISAATIQEPEVFTSGLRS